MLKITTQYFFKHSFRRKTKEDFKAAFNEINKLWQNFGTEKGQLVRYYPYVSCYFYSYKTMTCTFVNFNHFLLQYLKNMFLSSSPGVIYWVNQNRSNSDFLKTLIIETKHTSYCKKCMYYQIQLSDTIFVLQGT